MLVHKLLSLISRMNVRLTYQENYKTSFHCIKKHSYFNFLYRFPIVEPDLRHTKLRLVREGLEAIERITDPIAAVAVSQKSRTFFFLPVYAVNWLALGLFRLGP